MTKSTLGSGRSRLGRFYRALLHYASANAPFARRYFSPYPLIENESDEPPTSALGASGSHASLSASRIPGVSRSTIRSHGRTSDLLAGGLGRSHGAGDKSVLWVCDKCFKYMAEGSSWELHVVRTIPSARESHVLYREGVLTGLDDRESARASTRPDVRCINGAHTLSGRLMAQKKR